MKPRNRLGLRDLNLERPIKIRVMKRLVALLLCGSVGLLSATEAGYHVTYHGGSISSVRAYGIIACLIAGFQRSTIQRIKELCFSCVSSSKRLIVQALAWVREVVWQLEPFVETSGMMPKMRFPRMRQP